ncbi:MAG TPA: DUF1722 domain-containing protein [Vicinamibacterales bacterium]|nr:DUF1722 domain-containing protein [Vicinamibacterales bacterium]
MRIWDVSAGYLNRQSLLGEHRELHGLHVIVTEGRIGYARHPETLRWVRALGGLRWRHALLAAEMRLRGYHDGTPLRLDRRRMAWPETFVTAPLDQLRLLRQKYVGREHGRIPLPRNPQELWAHHKYSVMARDPEAYRRIGRSVATARAGADMAPLVRELVMLLREPPPPGRAVNALEHMWGYVRPLAAAEDRAATAQGPAAFLAAIQRLAVRHRVGFLLSSTALSELAPYVRSSSARLPRSESPRIRPPRPSAAR